MVEDTLAEVSSYVRNQESITVVTQQIDSDDLTLTLDDASQVSRGIVEIGNELVFIKSVNKQAGTATILPGGRGWKGSTATSHAVNTVVRNNPLYPKMMVQRALNDTIKSINLMALDNFTFEFDGTRYAYLLPSDFQDAVGVSWHAPDTTQVWPLIKRYRIDRNFYDDDTSTEGEALVLLEFPMPGRDVRVQYVKYPTPLSLGDDFSDTGLPASAEDVIRLGAMWRLVSTVDPGKVVAMSPSADLVDQPVGAGDSTAVARYIYQLFSVRLAEEKAKQADHYMSIIQYAR